MRSTLIAAVTACCLAQLVIQAVAAAPVTLSGTVSYTGGYGLSDSVYVSVVYLSGGINPVLVDYVALPRPGTQFSLPYAISFDNAGIPDSVLITGVLDEDHSGWDPGSLSDAITEPDIFGWYDGQSSFAWVDASASRTGLDFPLPRGEIHGDVVFAGGQTWATVVPRVVPTEQNPKWANLTAPGSYAVIGLYAGDYIVHGHSDVGSICWGSDWTCANPEALTLADGEIRTGVRLDFTVLSVDPQSWGRLKARYR